MDILINYWAVLGAGIFLIFVGMIWYGPLFGKEWMKIMGVDNLTKEEREKLMKGMMPMYAITFFLGLLTSFVLYYFIKLIPSRTGVDIAFWIWLGFCMPMAAGAMWDSRTHTLAFKKFLIIAGYQLLTLLVIGWVFTIW